MCAVVVVCVYCLCWCAADILDEALKSVKAHVAAGRTQPLGELYHFDLT